MCHRAQSWTKYHIAVTQRKEEEPTLSKDYYDTHSPSVSNSLILKQPDRCHFVTHAISFVGLLHHAEYVFFVLWCWVSAVNLVARYCVIKSAVPVSHKAYHASCMCKFQTCNCYKTYYKSDMVIPADSIRFQTPCASMHALLTALHAPCVLNIVLLVVVVRILQRATALQSLCCACYSIAHMYNFVTTLCLMWRLM